MGIQRLFRRILNHLSRTLSMIIHREMCNSRTESVGSRTRRNDAHPAKKQRMCQLQCSTSNRQHHRLPSLNRKISPFSQKKKTTRKHCNFPYKNPHLRSAFFAREPTPTDFELGLVLRSLSVKMVDLSD